MGATDVKDEPALTAEEARLARAAAAGDGRAFAALHERYEQRAFNLAYRIAGSEADAADAVKQAFLEVMRRLPRLSEHELAFGPQLFAATRNACHELTAGRQRPWPGEAIGESATPRGEGEPEEAEIREASMRLPEHQREALALRELEQLSYEEIATIMETNPNSVAQLISRARINLHDELRGNVLASVAAPSSECERALPLIAMREDGQLEATSGDEAWLDAHLADCHRCGLGVGVMQEACASYRAWAPIAAPPRRLEETMAKAAELTGGDWSEEVAEAPAARAKAAPLPGTAAARAAPESPAGKPPRRRLTLAAGLAALLLFAGVAAAVLAGGDPPATPVDPAAGTAPGPSAAAQDPGAQPANAGKAKGGDAKKKTRTTGAETAGTTAAETIPAPGFSAAPAPTGGGGAQSDPATRPSRPSEKTTVEPTQRATAPKPSPKPTPTSASASQPAPAATTTEESPPAEESPGKSSGKSNPPGKPADRPPK